MATEVSIVSIDDRERWNAEHSDGGLPSQSWSYAWALSAGGIDPKLAVVRAKDARMLLPFYRRVWGHSIDIATPIGLSGASITPPSAAPLAVWREFAAAQGWVAGYIQLAPFVDLEDAGGAGDLVTGNAVFLLDLDSKNDFLAAASQIVRRKLVRATKLGAVLVDDPVALAKTLRRLYPLTASRVGAPPSYRFSAETLDRWALDAESLMLGARIGDDIEAVCLFRVAAPHAEYLLMGSTENGRRLSTWLIAQGGLRLREAGVRWLNLGGGVRPGDGVYRFKERFRGVLKPLRAVRQIYDPATYDELCRRAIPRPGAMAYFPAYRAGNDPGLRSAERSGLDQCAQ